MSALAMAGAQAMRGAKTSRPGRRRPKTDSDTSDAAWDIDRDVLRGRELDYAQKFLPDALTLADGLEFLSGVEQRFFSQVQGRTYANMLGLCERWIGAKKLELGADYALGDQALVTALVRASHEELKHQELFRRVEAATARWMPPGYAFEHDPNAVARTVLRRSAWAVLALACQVERAVEAHCRDLMAPDPDLAEVYKDVFAYHAREECRHAALTELEWRREDAQLGADERDSAVDDLIALVRALDTIVQVQAALDTAYFVRCCGHRFGSEEARRIEAAMLEAYRLQYIVSGADNPPFAAVLAALVSPEQRARIEVALAPLRR